MTEPRLQRRLAAILAADVVGYSRLMQADEEGTLSGLKALWRDLFLPGVERHRGRVVKIMGDGALVEFASAVDSVDCALAVQAALAEANETLPGDRRVLLRIGINLGEVIVEGQDLYGTGVNVAARLEGMADPGGIFVSASVHEQVRHRTAAVFQDLGPKLLKNLNEPLQVFRVRMDGAEPSVPAPPAAPLPPRLPFFPLST